MVTLIPVLLAGGEGKRLGPLGTQGLPKQFHSFNRTESLLQQAARRAMTVAPAHSVITVASASHVAHAQEQLVAIDRDLSQHLIAEPMPRNTAAAVTLAAQYAVNHWDHPVLAVLPADHHIENPASLAAQLEEAGAMAEQGGIVLFGIAPSSPATHYGYVIHAEHSPAVTAFHEKPPAEVAELLIATGRAYWNSGMFVMRADVCLDEMRTHAPEVFLGARDAALALSGTPEGWQITERRFYDLLPSLPLDKAVMEKSRLLSVIPLASGWADLGTWEEVERMTADQKNQTAQP